MTTSKKDHPLSIWQIVVLSVAGLVLFWLFPAKLIARLAARLGRRAPCPSSLSWLVNSPFRRWYMRHVIERIGIKPGETVLELGPGPGAFTVEAARRLGPKGKLIVVDVQPVMIAQVEKRVRRARLNNVELHIANAYDLPVEDESVDRAFLVTVLPEIPNQARALAELRRVLRPMGMLSITEEFFDPDYQFPVETLRRAEASGFSLERRYGNVFAYTLNFWKGEGIAYD
ncbi:MAG: methyltransferase domain-containing protein [Anaerolineae bacterium]|nr:methyltransferase domain-containing protein [Anaerolineae bacterium]